MKNFKKVWDAITEDWKEYQINAHPEDRISLQDYAHELVGTTYMGVHIAVDGNHNITIHEL